MLAFLSSQLDLPQSPPPPPQHTLRTVPNSWKGLGEREGEKSEPGLSRRPVLPHSRWRRDRGKAPQRRSQRMRSAESRPGTQDGGSGAGEGEAEAAKRAVEQNV